MNKFIFDSWESILRTLMITIMAYALLIFLLRSSGKRTLSKMNAFDLIITIALGSTLATVMLNKNVALADGALGFFLLIFLQYFITFISVRYKTISDLIKSTPTLLVYKGQMLKEFMRKERIDEDEIYAVIRENGLSALSQAEAVVLETDGSLSVIKQSLDPQSAVSKRIEIPATIKNNM